MNRAVKSANAKYHDALKASEASALHRQRQKQDKADAERDRRDATLKSSGSEIRGADSLITREREPI